MLFIDGERIIFKESNDNGGGGGAKLIIDYSQKQKLILNETATVQK